MSTGGTHEHFELPAPARMLSDRVFGIALAVGFTVVSCSPLIHRRPVRKWALAIALVLVTAALFRPVILHPVAVLWMRLAHVINRVLTFVMMGLLFFLVITPIGLIRRLWLKDPLHLHADSAAATYWVFRQPPGPPPEDMAHPY